MTPLEEQNQLIPGTIKARPGVDLPYEESATRTSLADDSAWFLFNTKHGGGYTDGIEALDWPVVYTPPVLFEE